MPAKWVGAERPRVIALGLFLRIVHILLFSYILFLLPALLPTFFTTFAEN